jgi:dephospho-CoA kinase
VNALRQREDFILIEVIANPRIRWSRAKIRSRPGDPSSEAEFIESEKRELEATDQAGQALIATAAMADFKIENDGDLESLGSKLNQIVSDIS